VKIIRANHKKAEDVLINQYHDAMNQGNQLDLLTVICLIKDGFFIIGNLIS
jgi:hypothetical protein